MDYARTQKDIQWAVAQRLSPLALLLLNPSKLSTLSAKQLVDQPKPIFVYLCNKFWPIKSHIPYEHLIIYAALVGNPEVVKQCRAWILEAGKAPHYDSVIGNAAYRGHQNLVKQCRAWILEAGEIPDYNRIMAWAAYRGHQDLVKQCRAWILADGETPDYNWVMAWVAGGGHEKLLAQLKVWQQEQ